MKNWRHRLGMLALLAVSVTAAAVMVSVALKENLSWFRTPSEIVTGSYPEKASGRSFRLGGLVERGSVQHGDEGITFRVTDMKNAITVSYGGSVPNLFRDGQGVVAEGRIDGNGVFLASSLLAKHDEKYTPPEVIRAVGEGHPAGADAKEQKH